MLAGAGRRPPTSIVPFRLAALAGVRAPPGAQHEVIVTRLAVGVQAVVAGANPSAQPPVN